MLAILCVQTRVWGITAGLSSIGGISASVQPPLGSSQQIRQLSQLKRLFDLLPVNREYALILLHGLDELFSLAL